RPPAIASWNVCMTGVVAHLDHFQMICPRISHPDGRMLATGGDDRKILFWNLMQRQVAIALSLDDTAAHSLVLSRDGETLVTGSYRKIKVWR
ncbi:MAG: WD40 repeat domain-containing protein, partial [Nostoc sp.]